jgi:protein-tyrosine phosphatase
MDDGSRSTEESLAMLAMEAAQGISLVAATPHFDPRTDEPEAFLERRSMAEAVLREAAGEDPRLPRLLMGAEVRYFRGISDCEALPLLTLAGGKALLLELPVGPWPEEIWQELARFRDKRDILPIIAHLDRYMGLLHGRELPGRLAELPVLVQANSGFFRRRSTAPLALRLLREDRIHLLGSDCHSADRRAPDLGLVRDLIRRKAPDALCRIGEYETMILPQEALCHAGEKGS